MSMFWFYNLIVKKKSRIIYFFTIRFWFDGVPKQNPKTWEEMLMISWQNYWGHGWMCDMFFPWCWKQASLWYGNKNHETPWSELRETRVTRMTANASWTADIWVPSVKKYIKDPCAHVWWTYTYFVYIWKRWSYAASSHERHTWSLMIRIIWRATSIKACIRMFPG